MSPQNIYQCLQPAWNRPHNWTQIGVVLKLVGSFSLIFFCQKCHGHFLRNLHGWNINEKYENSSKNKCIPLIWHQIANTVNLMIQSSKFNQQKNMAKFPFIFINRNIMEREDSYAFAKLRRESTSRRIQRDWKRIKPVGGCQGLACVYPSWNCSQTWARNSREQFAP